jgi:hypothetical protein
MSRGVLGLLQLAGSVVFAAPVAIFGLFKLTAGEFLLGGGFLLLAALMVVGQELYTSPRDLPGNAVQRVTGWVVKDSDDEE